MLVFVFSASRSFLLFSNTKSPDTYRCYSMPVPRAWYPVPTPRWNTLGRLCVCSHRTMENENTRPSRSLCISPSPSRKASISTLALLSEQRLIFCPNLQVRTQGSEGLPQRLSNAFDGAGACFAGSISLGWLKSVEQLIFSRQKVQFWTNLAKIDS